MLVTPTPGSGGSYQIVRVRRGDHAYSARVLDADGQIVAFRLFHTRVEAEDWAQRRTHRPR